MSLRLSHAYRDKLTSCNAGSWFDKAKEGCQRGNPARAVGQTGAFSVTQSGHSNSWLGVAPVQGCHLLLVSPRFYRIGV